ncbi:MAG: hypothetical protein SFX72_16595 [Isosphaeraceae bacterium]|nr:hypothetical protein [Isosphaeraceae bacterium]
MDASFPLGREHGSDAGAQRSARRRAITLTPTVDGLEDRQLLSQLAGPRQVRLMKRREAIVQRARLRQARRLAAPNTFPGTPFPIKAANVPSGPAATSPAATVPATITSERYTNPAISVVSSNPSLITSKSLSNHPIVRLLGNGPIGIRITKPQIPSHILPPAPAAPVEAPAAPATPPAAEAKSAEPVVSEGSASAPASDAAAGATTPPSVDASSLDAIGKAFEKLAVDTKAINDRSTVTPVMLAALRDDYLAIESAAKTPADPTKLAAARATLATIGDALPTSVQKAQIRLDIAAIIDSRGVTDESLVEKLANDAESIVAAMNLTADDLALLAADLDAIETAMKSATPISMPMTMSSPVVTISDLLAGASNATTTIDLTPVAPPAMPRVMEGILSGIYGPLLGISTPESLTWAGSTLLDPIGRGPLPPSEIVLPGRLPSDVVTPVLI